MLEVSKWDKWQTFRKDRGAPPWIKVYRNLLSNEEWVSLSDKEKGQLVSIWILAADKEGKLSDNPAMIQRMCMLDSKPNINKFIELGFLSTTRLPLDNQESSRCQPVDSPEESREEERRAEKIPYQPILDLYHEVLTNNPTVSIYSDKRKRSVKKLYEFHDQHKNLQWWKRYFEQINSSLFLTGQVEGNGRKPFKADFDWILNLDNFVKIAEGKYHE